MPQYERRLYEPSDDAHAFDSDEDMEDEGSRLPLLIGIALIVLLSFAGVVWLAYTQGVQRGRADAPQMAAATQRDTNLASTDQKPTPYSKLKIYQPPKADADVASDDPAPPPSTVTAPNISNATPPASASKSQLDNASGKATETPKPPATKSTAPVAEPVSPPAKSATGAPRVITPSPTPAKPAKAVPQEPAPSATKPSAKVLPPKPAISGTRVLAMKSSAPKSIATASKPIAPATSALSPAEERAAKFIAAGPAASLPATTPATPATADAKPAPADAKPATADAKPAADAKPVGGGILLQIGSYKSDSEANASWQTYKGAHSSVAGYSSDVRKVDLGGKGTWYRLRIGPFASLAEANEACAKLKAQGGNCFPARQ
jgi:cell division septation protein DedD